MRVKRFTHDNFTHHNSSVCMEGKGLGGEGQCTLMRPTHNASFSQMGRSQGPACLLPLPPVQLYSLPDPSVWCKWYREREGAREGSPPLMFSLGTGCCLFDFQWKQRQHLQFEQIAHCCPVEQKTSAKEDWTSMARKEVWVWHGLQFITFICSSLQ